jgi:hypothetical protein
MSDQSSSSFSDDFDHRISKIAPCARRESNKNDATRSSHVCVDQLTKVLVLCDQNAIGCNRSLPDVIVFFPWRHFGNCDNIMTRRNEAHALLKNRSSHRLESASIIIFGRAF